MPHDITWVGAQYVFALGAFIYCWKIFQVRSHGGLLTATVTATMTIVPPAFTVLGVYNYDGPHTLNVQCCTMADEEVPLSLIVVVAEKHRAAGKLSEANEVEYSRLPRE